MPEQSRESAFCSYIKILMSPPYMEKGLFLLKASAQAFWALLILSCGKNPMVAENQRQRDRKRKQSFMFLKDTPSALCKIRHSTY